HGGQLGVGGAPRDSEGAGWARQFPPEVLPGLEAFRDLWDPGHHLGAGPHLSASVVGAEQEEAASRPAPSHLRYPDDGGSPVAAAGRCVGVSLCRADDHGLMCPSYQVTRDEVHSPRGRARLLQGWLSAKRPAGQARAVREALDLCMECKGCKSACPRSVDVATYKADFLSHYYRFRLRPRLAHSAGRIYRWARLAAWAPGLANALLEAPGVGRLLRWAAGFAPERRLPRFAPRTFRERYLARSRSPRPGQPRVILWVDTFYNHFRPAVACAAVEALEAAGFQVDIPPSPLCCGRPLYGFGLLEQAKLHLRETLLTLETEIVHGTPVVGLEPGCLSVLRDELLSLFPGSPAARTLARQTHLLPEFLMRYAPQHPWPQLEGEALVLGHCHQRAQGGAAADVALLERLGLRARPLEVGCCGMAGAFGYGRDTFAMSLQCADRALVPALQAASSEALIVASGFSCAEQIAQTSLRQALHPAEVVQFALRGGAYRLPGQTDASHDAWRPEERPPEHLAT
ncbi:MAG TPA: (Fe-S)-binding protein, partial [Myxococcota bacterium]|nr:(Fe-S)-binding protein [Myxococcota bacterium]